MIATLVVGSRGLLGSAVCRVLESEDDVIVSTISVKWTDPDSVRSQLQTGVSEWLRESEATEHELYWTAGAAVPASTQEKFDSEAEVFGQFVDVLVHELATSDRAKPVSVVLASSAGGVYAGAIDPPFSETTEPNPVGGYGRLKLAMEKRLISAVNPQLARVLICRIANLYGEGQSLLKQQGFVSYLCRSFLTRTPIPVYVSLDTIRDYVHVDDAARMIVASCRLQQERGDIVAIKNVASFQPASIAQILQTARAVFKRRHEAILASSPFSLGQVRDLRLASTVYPEIDELPRRSLIVGMDQLRLGMVGQIQSQGKDITQ